MEKKGTQRIVGVLVIIALVVILLPLLFGKNEPQTQQVVAKAPAFPDQPQQPTSLASNDSAGSSDSTTSSEISVPVPNLPVPNTVASTAEPVKASDSNAVTLGTATASASPKTTPAASSQQAASSSLNKPLLNDSTLTTASVEPQAKVASPAIETAGKLATSVSAASANSNTINNTVASTPTASSDAPIATHIVTAMHKAKAIPAVIKSKRKLVKAPVVKTAQFKQSAWAIQMGNFKNKENAVRLTDQLRAAGFKAFTRDYKLSSGKGVRTRVFIGPEFKQTTAVALSGKVQDKLKIRGIVVSFKPLEL